ncbi:MAG TPA: hypothetical protein VH951_06700 [Dehalococcoidia bacterium]
MSDELSLRTISARRGARALSSDGETLGDIREVIYDPMTGAPVWLTVGAHSPPRFRSLFVPVGGATVEEDGVHVGYSRDLIDNQPHADFGAGFDNAGEERQLYDYFGVPMHNDLRVLHEHDELPGLERVSNT